MRIFAVAAMALVVMSCSSSPASPMSATALPAPDYSQASSWLALPGPMSIMNEVPPGSGLSNLQNSAPVDVFYVLPTTGNTPQSAGANVAYNDPAAFAFAQKIGTMQATPFNNVGRIYAPLYRGVPNWVWGSPLATAQAPLDLAYADVKHAFDYYIAHYNHGRPFILAGHSQGDVHPMRLIYDEIARTSLEKRLVAAYVMGQPVARDFFDRYPRVKECQSAIDTACQITWDAFNTTLSARSAAPGLAAWWNDQYYWLPSAKAWVAPVPPLYRSMNPLNWSYSTARAPAATNLGSMQTHIKLPMQSATPPLLEPLIVPGVVGAYAAPGALFVSPSPPKSQFSVFYDGGETLTSGIYHPIDFQLFWMNIRVNARDRTNAWLEKNGAKHPLITGAITAAATSGRPFAYSIQTIGTATSFRATGLPPGLAISATSGAISGTPSKSGTYAVQITAANASGSSTGELWLTVK